MAEAIPTLKTLDAFIETLSAQRGLHRKVRLLAHYWRQVRDLPSEDRQRIALALGSESAWNRLEKLFGADGHLSEGELVVKSALRRVGTADPAELRTLAKRLRSGDYAEVGNELLDAMGQALDAEVGDEPTSPLEPEPEPEPEQALEPAPEPTPAIPPEPEPESESEPEPALESEPEPDTEQPAKIPAMPPLPPWEPVKPARESGSEQARESDRHAEARDERRRLLTASGTGWRQRQLLSELIREGELGSLDEALDLAELLESDAQRVWCLGDLVQHWPLDGEQLTHVLDAAPSAVARTRLQNRHERATPSRAQEH